VNVGEAEEVLDEAMVLVSDAHDVAVLDGWDDFVEHGLLEEVFELVDVLDVVFVAAVERVEVVEAVIVFVGKALVVCIGLDVDVFDVLMVFVDVIEAVVVFVDVDEGVCMFVGKDERVSVVVFVDVLDCVDERESIIPAADRPLWPVSIDSSDREDDRFGTGGVEAMRPIVVNRRSHRIVYLLI
jgi:hypothetical protein